MATEKAVSDLPRVPGASVQGSSGGKQCPGCDNNVSCDNCRTKCDNICDTFEYVYRADSRKPDEIFKIGFQTRTRLDPRATLVTHILAKTNCFISTTFKCPGLEPENKKQKEKFGKFLHNLLEP